MYLRVLAVADDGLHFRRAFGVLCVRFARQLLVGCLSAVVQDHLSIAGDGSREQDRGGEGGQEWGGYVWGGGRRRKKSVGMCYCRF